MDEIKAGEIGQLLRGRMGLIVGPRYHETLRLF